MSELGPWSGWQAAAENRAPKVPAMNEKTFQAQVIALAHLRGCIVYHTHLSIHSEAGFPDIVIARPGMVLFRELKTDRGKVSTAQQVWIDTLNAGGADAAVWRPADLVSGRIMRELAPAWAA